MSCSLTISKISDQIYLSGMNYSMGDCVPKKIKELGIKYIVSCVAKSGVSEMHKNIMFENPSITILYLSLNDNLEQNLWEPNINKIYLEKYSNSADDVNEINMLLNSYKNKPMIEIAYNFIDSALNTGAPILIHCMAGISRSVSILSYYFMKKYRMSFIDTMLLIKAARPIVNPNNSFIKQLTSYELQRQNYDNKCADLDIKMVVLSYL